MKLSDIDFERKTIHIRYCNYKKDRVVPLSDFVAKGLKKYLAVEHPLSVFIQRQRTPPIFAK